MSFFEQFRVSLGDFKSYRRLAAQPFGRSFTFLVLFLVVIFAVGGIKFTIDYKTFMNEALQQVAENLPEFRLADGKLTVDGPMPYQFADNDTMIVIDTTGQLTPDIIDSYSQGLFIDADRMVMKQPAQTRQILWSELGPVTFTKADVITLMQSLDWLLVVFGILYFVYLLLSKMFGILVLSLVALIANAIIKSGFDYARLWNVALYSMVVPTLVSFCRAMIGVSVPNWWIIHWGIAVAYIIIALRSAKEELPVAPPPPVTM
ncbi:MAG: DUF1189 domain-containing protein [Chloroflexota bacterium]